MRPFLSAALALACALGLAACGEKPAGEGERTDEQAAPLPAMWELASADGTVEGWLFGTIHSLPDGTTWETELISDTVDDADLLIVEIAALEDSAAISHVFARLARTDGLPPLSRRLPAGDQAALRDMLAATSYSDSDFTATESWAAALMLAQGVRGGNPENGVDRALLRRFEGRPVRELEGAVRQLGIFDTLPESDQRDLLAAVVKQGRDTSEESAELARIWRSGDMDSLARENSRRPPVLSAIAHRPSGQPERGLGGPAGRAATCRTARPDRRRRRPHGRPRGSAQPDGATGLHRHARTVTGGPGCFPTTPVHHVRSREAHSCLSIPRFPRKGARFRPRSSLEAWQTEDHIMHFERQFP